MTYEGSAMERAEQRATEHRERTRRTHRETHNLSTKEPTMARRNENRRAMATRRAHQNTLPRFDRLAHAANDRPDRELFGVALAAGAVAALWQFGSHLLPTAAALLGFFHA